MSHGKTTNRSQKKHTATRIPENLLYKEVAKGGCQNNKATDVIAPQHSVHTVFKFVACFIHVLPQCKRFEHLDVQHTATDVIAPQHRVHNMFTVF